MPGLDYIGETQECSGWGLLEVHPREGMAYTKETETLHSTFLPLTQAVNLCRSIPEWPRRWLVVLRSPGGSTPIRTSGDR